MFTAILANNSHHPRWSLDDGFGSQQQDTIRSSSSWCDRLLAIPTTVTTEDPLSTVVDDPVNEDVESSQDSHLAAEVINFLGEDYMTVTDPNSAEEDDADDFAG